MLLLKSGYFFFIIHYFSQNILGLWGKLMTIVVFKSFKDVLLFPLFLLLLLLNLHPFRKGECYLNKIRHPASKFLSSHQKLFMGKHSFTVFETVSIDRCLDRVRENDLVAFQHYCPSGC
jgi:hypothetical protein